MKLYLDDNRPTPAGWYRAYGYMDCIERLSTGQFDEVSLDHDLGEEHYDDNWTDEKTGYDVLLWLIQAVRDGLLKAPLVHIHSWNPVGRERMVGALEHAKYPRIGRVRPGL